MNIMMFCSNPVDGGTAKVFYELVTSFKENNSNDDRIYAGANVNNPVAIYNKIYFLERLEVYSEEEVCKNLYQGNIFSRAIKKSIRMIKYRPIKENNIKIMKEYLSRNKMFYTMILKKIFLPNFVLKVMTKKFVEKLQIWLQYQIIQKIGYYLILI